MTQIPVGVNDSCRIGVTQGYKCKQFLRDIGMALLGSQAITRNYSKRTAALYENANKTHVC